MYLFTLHLCALNFNLRSLLLLIKGHRTIWFGPLTFYVLHQQIVLLQTLKQTLIVEQWVSALRLQLPRLVRPHHTL